MAKQPTQQVITKKHLARLEKERIQQRYILIGTTIVILLIIGIIIYGVLDQTVIKAMRPVAKVGNETVSTADFQKEVRFQRYRLIDQLRGITADPMMLQFFGSYIQQIQTQLVTPSVLGQQVVDTMVEDLLVAKEAEKRGITVTDEEVNRAFEEAFGYFPNGTPSPTPSKAPVSTSTLSPTQEALFPPTKEPTATTEPTAGAETPTAPAETPSVEPTEGPTATATAAASPTPNATPTITPTPTQYSPELFEQNVSDYVDSVSEVGYTRDDLRDLIRRQLLKQKVTDAIAQEIPTTADQVWARHILVATEDEAKQVLDRLNNGETFADLAREVSTDSSNASSGGDLGWFTTDRMVAPFSEAAFAMKIGEISQPVQTDFGYHIIQVLGREERALDAEQLEQARQTAYEEWLTRAKEENNVETYDANWSASVPDDPEIPADVLSILAQLQSQNQQLPLEALPTE